MARKYYTLIVKEPGEEWAPQFGDYDRNVVAEEGDDYRSNSSAKLKIICTGPKQAEINAEVARLNVTAEMQAGLGWKGK